MQNLTIATSCASALAISLSLAAPAAADYSITDIVDAAKRNDTHAVHKLLELDRDSVEATDSAGYTALHWAGIRGHWRVFGELLAAGAPVNAIGGDGGSPLHWACHHDRPEMIARLLDAGAEVDIHNRWGRTPLHVAARRGCREVATLLLARGSDPNAVTKEGWTPLHVAYRSGHPGLVEVLLEHGADPGVRDGDRLTPAESAHQRPSEIPLQPADLEHYVGIYDLGGGFTVEVWLEDRVLRVREFAPDQLYPTGEDRFWCRQEPWQLSFERDSTGQVTAVEIQFLRRTVRGSRVASPRYVGSQVCAQCHLRSEHGNQTVPWMRSRHAHAYWRLGADWALFLARLRPHYHDVEQPLEDHRCLLCHATGTQDPDSLFASTFRRQEGVGCEACHGPGSDYIDPEIMSDRARFLAHGGRIPDESTCRSCHRNSERFAFDEWWPKIAHAREPDAPSP